MNAVTAVPSAQLNESLGQFKNSLSTIDCIQPSSYKIPDFREDTQSLRNGINHLKLDDTFISKCPAWRDQFSQRQLANERSAAISVSDRGTHFAKMFGTTMGPNSIKNLQENQLAEQGQQAKDNFNNLHCSMRPIAGASQHRVNQFCDWIGVTDRYTGYRNNLTRSHQGQISYGNGSYPEMSSNRSIQRFNLRQISAPVRSMAAPDTMNSGSLTNRAKTGHHKSIQEQCGIVTTYPGQTEYKDRYVPPKSTALDYHYKVNPIPNFSIIGRPIQPTPKQDLRSMYNVSYGWPSAANYPKLPWLKR